MDVVVSRRSVHRKARCGSGASSRNRCAVFRSRGWWSRIWGCCGTRPSRVTKNLPLTNWRPFPEVAPRALAASGPMPGIVIRRRAVSPHCTLGWICRVISSILFSSSLKSFQESASSRRVEGSNIVAARYAGRVDPKHAGLFVKWKCRIPAGYRRSR